MSKKQNRRYITRRIRRILNRSLDFFKSVSNKKLHRFRYGSGLGRSVLNVKEYDDDCDVQ